MLPRQRDQDGLGHEAALEEESRSGAEALGASEASRGEENQGGRAAKNGVGE